MTNTSKAEEVDAYGDKYFKFTLADGSELRVFGSKWAIKKEFGDTHRADWEEEFEKRTDASNYELGEFHTLKDNGESLLNTSWYPESEYEIDADKIKSFISHLLSKQREDIIKMIEDFDIKTGIRGEPVENPLMRLYDVKRFIIQRLREIDKE